jgi:hypothetical protein
MIRILTPTRAVFKNDLITRLGIIKRLESEGYPTGLEVVLVGGPEKDLKETDKIKANLENHAKNTYLTVHAPIEDKDFTKKWTDLTAYDGVETFYKTLKLGIDIGAKIVNVHSNKYIFGKELQAREFQAKEKHDLQRDTALGIDQARVASGYNGIISLENWPYPPMGDRDNITTIGETPYDPVIYTLNDMRQMALLFRSEKDKVCLDTCHYGITRKILNESMEHGKEKRGVLDVPVLDEQPELSRMPSLMGPLLGYVHFSDCKGTWDLSKNSFYQEGFVPGEGDLGTECSMFLRNLERSDLPVLLEVKDEDFQKCAETRRAMDYVSSILKKYASNQQNSTN